MRDIPLSEHIQYFDMEQVTLSLSLLLSLTLVLSRSLSLALALSLAISRSLSLLLSLTLVRSRALSSHLRRRRLWTWWCWSSSVCWVSGLQDPPVGPTQDPPVEPPQPPTLNSTSDKTLPKTSASVSSSETEKEIYSYIFILHFSNISKKQLCVTNYPIILLFTTIKTFWFDLGEYIILFAFVSTSRLNINEAILWSYWFVLKY